MDTLAAIQDSIITQADAMYGLASNFNLMVAEEAAELMFLRSVADGGYIVTIGMGKSGNVAAKVASTMTSTGTPAYFLQPGEALHGGLGILRPLDTILIFSKSGETYEIIEMLPAFNYHQLPIILVTCNQDSTLAKAARIVLQYDAEECCGINLIPTTSTTLALVIGDALSMALSKKKGFTVEELSRFHPGGELGQIARDSVGKMEFE